MSKTMSYVLGPHLYQNQSHRVVKGEDTWVLQPECNIAGTELAVFGVFDGHGNKDAAKFAAKHVVEILMKVLHEALANRDDERGVYQDASNLTEDQQAICKSQDALSARMPGALFNTFLSLDKEFQATGQDSGTTATVVVVVGWEVFVANIGDSLAYLDTGSECIRISANHRIDDSPSERKRIKAAGGSIARAAIKGVGVGPLRAWPGGLAMGRTIGDPSAGGFVHSEPEVHQFTFPLVGGRLVIASDGLWDAVNPKTACHHIRGMASTQGTKALVKLATQKTKSNRDDVTVVVVDALTHNESKIPIGLSKTVNTPLARTLSSMSSASASSGITDPREGVDLLKPLENKKGNGWQHVWQRRAAMAQHLIWMEEVTESMNRLNLERTESCPPIKDTATLDCIEFEAPQDGRSVQEVSMQTSDWNDSGWQSQSKPRHRRAVSDMHCRQTNHRRGPGGSRRAIFAQEQTYSNVDRMVLGNGPSGERNSVEQGAQKVLIKTGGSVIEVSLGSNSSSKTHDKPQQTDQHGGQVGADSSVNNCNYNEMRKRGNGNHRSHASFSSGDFECHRQNGGWDHKGRGGGSRRRKNTQHHRSYSQVTPMSSGRRGGETMVGNRQHMKHFASPDDVINA